MEPKAKNDECFVVKCTIPEEKKTVYNYFGYKIGSADSISSYKYYDENMIVGRLKKLNKGNASIFTNYISAPEQYEPYEVITYEEFEKKYLNIKVLDCFEIIQKMNQGE